MDTSIDTCVQTISYVPLHTVVRNVYEYLQGDVSACCLMPWTLTRVLGSRSLPLAML